MRHQQTFSLHPNAAAMLLAMSVLAGCAASYSVPTSGPTARVRVAVAQAGPSAATNVNQFKSSKCESPVSLGYFGGALNYSNNTSIGIPGSKTHPPGQFLERVIEADSRQMFTFRTLYENKRCFVTASFVPSAGHDYEMLVDWNSSHCRVRVGRIVSDGAGSVLTSLETTARQEETCEKGFN